MYMNNLIYTSQISLRPLLNSPIRTRDKAESKAHLIDCVFIVILGEILHIFFIGEIV